MYVCLLLTIEHYEQNSRHDNNLAAGPILTDKMPHYLRRRRSQKVNISSRRGGREGEMEIWMAAMSMHVTIVTCGNCDHMWKL